VNDNRLKTVLQAIVNLSALETLEPPNFMTTHGDSAISGGAPNAELIPKLASSVSLISRLNAELTAKKNPPGISSRVC
jgi:hypothetical protein